MGSREKRISFLMDQKSYKKRPHLFTRVGEPVGNEIEKPPGKSIVVKVSYVLLS